MKTWFSIVLLLLTLVCGTQAAALPLAGQPSCVGISENFAYATLFEESRRYGLSCTHFYPPPNAVLTFGNGETARVKSVVEVRGGYYKNYEYDVSIVEFELPVNAEPAKTFWQKPHAFVQNVSEIEYFGKNGWTRGTNAFVKTSTFELYNGIWFTTPEGTVTFNDSGAPVFFRHNGEPCLVAVLWGSRAKGAGGCTNTVWQVFGQFGDKLPEQYRPPTEVTWAFCRTLEGHMTVKLTQPPFEGMRIHALCGKKNDTWSDAVTQPECCAYEEPSLIPWQSHVVWNSPRGIFRGQSP